MFETFFLIFDGMFRKPYKSLEMIKRIFLLSDISFCRLVELELALAHGTFVACFEALSQTVRMKEMMAGCHSGLGHAAQTHRAHIIEFFDLLDGRLPVPIQHLALSPQHRA